MVGFMGSPPERWRRGIARITAGPRSPKPTAIRWRQITRRCMHSPDDVPLLQRLRFYLTPFDGRYEDLTRGNVKLNVLRDFMAGLIVAMVAIPLAMGFAMASGLRPEQGIVGGAVAGLVGALFGGSKYQVYGPAAAFIPVFAGMMASYTCVFLILAAII